MNRILKATSNPSRKLEEPGIFFVLSNLAVLSWRPFVETMLLLTPCLFAFLSVGREDSQIRHNNAIKERFITGATSEMVVRLTDSFFSQKTPRKYRGR